MELRYCFAVCLLLLCRGSFAQPVNDNFANRIPLTGTNVVIRGSIVGATFESEERFFAPGTNTVWWSWTAPANGFVSLNNGGTDFTAGVLVATGSALANLQRVVDNIIFYPGLNFCGVGFPVTAETTYQLAVGGYPAGEGDIVLNLVFHSRPPNDDFAQRINLGTGNAATVGSTDAATVELNEPPGRSVWWFWTAAESGPTSIHVVPEAGVAPCQSYGGLSSLAIFTGSSLPQLTQVPAKYAFDAFNIQLTFEAEVGTTYPIRVSGDFVNFNNFRLQIAHDTPPAVLLARPLAGENFSAGDPILFSAGALDADGTVDRVELFLDYKPFVSFTNAPFRVTRSDVTTGRHTLYAIATDNLGFKGITSTIQFEVRPANDDFARRIPIAGSPVSVTNVVGNATREAGEPYDLNPGTIWWTWTPPLSALFTVSANTSSGTPPVLAIYTGDALTNLRLVTNNATAGDLAAFPGQLTLYAVVGTAYQIALGTYDSSGLATLRIAPNQPPTARIISPTNNAAFFVPTLVTCTAEASDSDGALREVDFYLDGVKLPGTLSNSLFQVSVLFTNQSYSHLIRAVATDNLGAIGVSEPVSFITLPPPPPNNNFVDRLPLTGAPLSLTASNTNADREAGETTEGDSTVWWSWTASSTGLVTFRVTSSDFGPFVGVYSGETITNLQSIVGQSVEGNEDPRQARVSFKAAAGTVYQIVVGSYFGSYGDFTLELLTNGMPTVNITYPANAARVIAPSEIILSADAADSDGTVARVEFFFNSNLIGTVTNPPFHLSFAVSNLFPVSYQIQARAIDSQGLASSFSTVAFTAFPAPPPNDDFANRVPLIGSFASATVTNVYATNEPKEPTSGPGSLWWDWIAPTAGPVTITATSENRSTSLEVSVGETLAQLQIIASSSDQARVDFLAERDTTYHIAVIGGENGGNVTLNVAQTAAPTVKITAPASGAKFLVGQPFTVNADATDLDGAIARVDFYADNTLLGAVTVPPYRLTLTNNSATQFRLFAEATDDHAVRTRSGGLLIFVVPPQPPNDYFADRIPLAGKLVEVRGTNTLATAEPGEPALNVSGTVWWSWTAPAAGSVTISISSTSSYFTAQSLEVFTGESLAALRPVIGTSFTDTEYSYAFQFRFVALAGERYAIAVANTGGDSSYTLKIAQDEPPAVVVTSPASGARILYGTDMILSADVTDSDGAIAFVEFFLDFNPAVVITNRPFQLHLNSESLSFGPHRLQVRATDDFGQSTRSEEVQFRVVLPAPPNDDFANRAVLTGPFVIVNGSNADATKEPDEPILWAASASGSIWWTWKAPASGNVTLANERQNSAVLAVFIGDTVTNLTLVATNYSDYQIPATQLAFTVVAGTEYQIMLDTLEGNGSTQDNLLSLYLETEPRALLQNPVRLADGRLRLRLTTDPGSSWQLAGSTNLLDWLPIGAPFVSPGNLDFEDAEAANLPRRFYRAMMAP